MQLQQKQATRTDAAAATKATATATTATQLTANFERRRVLITRIVTRSRNTAVRARQQKNERQQEGGGEGNSA